MLPSKDSDMAVIRGYPHDDSDESDSPIIESALTSSQKNRKCKQDIKFVQARHISYPAARDNDAMTSMKSGAHS